MTECLCKAIQKSAQKGLIRPREDRFSGSDFMKSHHLRYRKIFLVWLFFCRLVLNYWSLKSKISIMRDDVVVVVVLIKSNLGFIIIHNFRIGYGITLKLRIWFNQCMDLLSVKNDNSAE